MQTSKQLVRLPLNEHQQTHTHPQKKTKNNNVINQYACFARRVSMLTPWVPIRSGSLHIPLTKSSCVHITHHFMSRLSFSCPQLWHCLYSKRFAQWFGQLALSRSRSPGRVGRIYVFIGEKKRQVNFSGRWARNLMNERIPKNISKIQINQNWNDNRLTQWLCWKLTKKYYYWSETMNLFIQMSSTYFTIFFYLSWSTYVCVCIHIHIHIHNHQNIRRNIYFLFVNKLWIKYFSLAFFFVYVSICVTVQFLFCIWSLWYCWWWWWCRCCCCCSFSDDIRKSSMDQFVMWIFDRISSSSFFLLYRFFFLQLLCCCWWCCCCYCCYSFELVLFLRGEAHNQSIFSPVQTVKRKNLINIPHTINIVFIFGNCVCVYENANITKQEVKV